MAENAISPTRNEDFPEWYQQVIRGADLAENSAVRGCMVIKPWGYGIWENIQRILDQRIKDTGHENAYFPLFIPLSFLEKEASHVEGFAKECAVVTHHRLEEKNGKLIPTGELEEPLIVRPTSETIIGESFSRWVHSYRDLPLLINQWANVVRWEMRTRLFLRTAEFLWQEGHTAHATRDEAIEETRKMHEVYRTFLEEALAIPVIPGEKTAGERFPGAENSFTVEGMMQDRKALQAGTSHFLGQNFAKAANISFSAENGEIEHAYTTSWGVSTRMIGGLIMVHSDDDGLRLPPRMAPKQVVINPVIPKPEAREAVERFADELSQKIRVGRFHDRGIEVTVDKRDIRGGDKNWQWIKRGVPIRIEVGPRDIESKQAVVLRRDKPHKEKLFISVDELPAKIPQILQEMQNGYLNSARSFRDAHIERGISSYDDLKRYFTPKNAEKPEIHGGFAVAKWAGSAKDEEKLAELKLSIRCIPFDQSGTTGKCIVTGKETQTDVIIAKAY